MSAPSAHSWLAGLPAAQEEGRAIGITSVCSAHPEVITAALIEARETGQMACIEATCNQVNQDGGYTGMTPADFRDRVLRLADQVGFDPDRIILGGDHLGPNPWRHGPAATAMDKALTMTRAYAAAGFGKIHADASMSCADDPVPLPVRTIAERAAALVAAADEGAAAGGHPAPLFIIGTEVPVPGGAAEELDTLTPTSPEDAAETLRLHEEVFTALGLSNALGRVIAMVVQPGVEFGHANVIPYDPSASGRLVAARQRGVLYEAHSTDYQTTGALCALVQGGFGILKVGPGLTFALREALYGLDQIAGALGQGYRAGQLPDAMEQLMLAEPGDWQAYYSGPPATQKLQRHFSYSDRIRYYWARPEAEAACAALFEALGDGPLPETLISQYLPRHYADVLAGDLPATAPALCQAAIRTALAPYSRACRDEDTPDPAQG